MTERIHLVVDRSEKDQFRRLAAREGKTLSEWLRAAAHERAEAASTARALETPEALRAFFEACDRRERGREPDWDEHKKVIARSIAGGSSET